MRNIAIQLGKEDLSQNNIQKKVTKITPNKLKDQVKFLEEQFESEKNLRKQGELLNEQLHAQLLAYEKQLNCQDNEDQYPEILNGFDLVPRHELNRLLQELDSYKNSNSLIRKVKSETVSKPLINSKKRDRQSASEHTFAMAEKVFRTYILKI